jgi:transposase
VKVASEPDVPTAWFGSLGFEVTRIGLEAGPLSQWLFAAMQEAGLAVELLETRHVRAALKAMPVKTDRHDARGIAQLMGSAGSGRCTASRCRHRRSAHC